MFVKVKFFAFYEDFFGKKEDMIPIAESSTVQDLFEKLMGNHPLKERWLQATLFAVNESLTTPNTPLKQGDELALIPPVSGG